MKIEQAILDFLSKDTTLRPLIQQIETPETKPSKDVYFALMRSIVSQQLSVKAAATIFGRFLGLFTDEYPNTTDLLGYDIEDLRQVGLSRQKANYLQNVATFFETESLQNFDWSQKTDEEIIKYLTQIKGVGKWTVQMILMFELNRPDVFPIDDLAIRQNMVALYDVTATGKALKPALTEIANKWQPYRSYACFYIWKSKDLGLI